MWKLKPTGRKSRMGFPRSWIYTQIENAMLSTRTVKAKADAKMRKCWGEETERGEYIKG
jgi:hypothetical protein